MFRGLARLALTRSRSVLAASGLVLALAIAALFYGGSLSGGATRGILIRTPQFPPRSPT